MKTYQASFRWRGATHKKEFFAISYCAFSGREARARLESDLKLFRRDGKVTAVNLHVALGQHDYTRRAA